MAITVKHSKVSTIPDDSDTDLVRPSDWNADHSLSGIGTMAEQNANNVAITGGTISGVTISGMGDVVGPASATDNAIARFDSTTGKLIQNSVVTVSDAGGIAGATTITDINYVDFNTSYATTLTAGQLGWNGNDTLGLGMIGGNVIQHIGEDQFFYCKATSAITKGEVVMFTGAVGASGVPTGAPATGITDGTYIMGVAAESISLNGFGLVQCFGALRNVNTAGYSDGDILWYNPSVTGGLTKTKPSAPNVKVQMAAVINGGSSGGGTILIRINPGSTLGGTDSNAEITSPTGGQILSYDQTNGYWKNINFTDGTGISISEASNGAITVTNTAPDQTVSLTGAGTTSISGTYPNFTITSNDQYVGTVTSVAATAGTGISVTGSPITSSGTLTITNTAPDQTVTLTAGTGISVTGTYPSFTVTNTGLSSYPGSGIAVSTGSAWGTSLTAPSGTIVGTTDTQTLTNKTFTGFTETVYVVSDAAGVALSPTNGTIQTWTLGANRTPTAGTWAAGQSMTLMIDDGTAYAVTWTTLGVVWAGGTAPTLATSGYTVVELWKVGTTIYGALVGSVA